MFVRPGRIGEAWIDAVVVRRARPGIVGEAHSVQGVIADHLQRAGPYEGPIGVRLQREGAEEPRPHTACSAREQDQAAIAGRKARRTRGAARRPMISAPAETR